MMNDVAAMVAGGVVGTGVFILGVLTVGAIRDRWPWRSRGR